MNEAAPSEARQGFLPSMHHSSVIVLLFTPLRSAQRRTRLLFPVGVAITCPHHTPAAIHLHYKSSFICLTLHVNDPKIQFSLKFSQKTITLFIS